MAPIPAKTRKMLSEGYPTRGRPRLNVTSRVENYDDDDGTSTDETPTQKTAEAARIPQRGRPPKQAPETDSPKSSQHEQVTPTKRRKREINSPGQAQKVHSETFVMKLFDRSLDLFKYYDNSPLYPICRAWIKNQPRNPNISKHTEHHSAPRKDNGLEILEKLRSGEIQELTELPAPKPETIPRLPTLKNDNNDVISYMDAEMSRPVDIDVLIARHKVKWKKVKANWIGHTTMYYKRYDINRQILFELCKRFKHE